jgi:hypothetical protein
MSAPPRLALLASPTEAAQAAAGELRRKHDSVPNEQA